MSFAEQLALASSKKKLNIATTRKAATAANHSSLSSSEGGSFADRIRAASTPTAAGGATPSSKIKITATTPSQLQPTAPVSSSSFTFADELHQKSQQSGRRKATSHVHSNIEHQHTHDGSDDDDNEYSAVGFSLSSTPTRAEIVQTTSTTDAARNKKNKKKLKPVIIVPSESSVGVEQQQQEEVPQLSPPLQRQQQQRQQQQQQQQSSNNLPQHPINQSHNDNINADNSNTNNNKEVFGAWAQIESLKRRVHEAEQRAEMASYELKVMKDHNNHRSSTTIIPVTISNMDDGGRHANKVDEEDNDYDDDDGNDALQNDYNYSEIDEWKRRALEAEERLLAQRRHDPIMIELPPPQQQHFLSPQQQQQQQQQQLLTPPQSTTQSSVCTSTTTTTPRVGFLDNESSSLELIRLKNAEIDVLRSQIHRLERRIQEECDRSEDLYLRQQQQQQQQTSYRHHYHNCDGSTSPPSVVLGDDIVGRDELQLLRNEIQYLKYELRRKGTAVTNNLTAGDKSSYNAANGNKTSGSTTGSTLSSLDENENNYVEGEEEVGDDDDNGGGGGCCSSWGLCCVRRRAARRRGYGRV